MAISLKGSQDIKLMIKQSIFEDDMSLLVHINWITLSL